MEDSLYAHTVVDSRECREKQLAVIKALLECGASPNDKHHGLGIRDEQPLALDPILRQVLESCESPCVCLCVHAPECLAASFGAG